MKAIFKYKILLFITIMIYIPLTLSAKPAESIKEIRERGYIVVAMIETEQYPFFYTDSKGNFTGLDVDIAQEVAYRLDINLVINRDAKSFNDLIPLVVDGTVDFAASKLSRTLSRSRLVMYTEPYVVFRKALLMNRIKLASAGIDNDKMDSFLKNFNASIGVIANSSYARYAKTNFPSASVLSYDSWDDVVSAGLNGEVFAIYRDELEIFKIIKANPQYNLRMKPVIIADQKDPIAIAVHPSNLHLVYYLNQVLENMNIESDAQKLLEIYKE